MKTEVCRRYVYKISNTLNEKNYIGQRTFDGDPSLDSYFGSGKLLNKAIDKYGKENFVKVILEEGYWDKETLDEKEIYWIRYYRENDNCDYNISAGGTGGDVLKDSPELRKAAIIKHKESMKRKPKEELEAMYKHHGEALKATIAAYTQEQRDALAKKRSKIQRDKYSGDPDYYQMRVEINRKNAEKQSKTQKSQEWINSVGKDSHRRQNIHVAKTFYLDSRTGRLYTLSAIAELLHIKKTLNVRKKLKENYPFIIFIDNTEENDLIYNFITTVITACYANI